MLSIGIRRNHPSSLKPPLDSHPNPELINSVLLFCICNAYHRFVIRR